MTHCYLTATPICTSPPARRADPPAVLVQCGARGKLNPDWLSEHTALSILNVDWLTPSAVAYNARLTMPVG
uniref:Uncharacterized protein n=1 Tax=Anguilla anguilla TaxID=7936 RepID=A0A0E9PAI6_ANGAN